jgi:hypothetical protein
VPCYSVRHGFAVGVERRFENDLPEVSPLPKDYQNSAGYQELTPVDATPCKYGEPL